MTNSTLPTAAVAGFERAAAEPNAGLFQLQLRAAEAFAQQGRLREMRAAWRAALKRLPAGGTLFERLERFKLLVALKRYPAAFSEGERILDLDRSPQVIEVLKFPWNNVLFSRADIRGPVEKDHRRTLLALGRSLPRSPWPPYYLALLTGRHAPERVALMRQTARRAAPRYGWMRGEFAHSLLMRFDYRGAVREFRAAAAATTPHAWRSYAFCAETYLFLGRPRKALEEFLLAVEAAPPHEKGDALAWMGELCLWMGRYRDALALFERAIPLGGLFGYCWRGAAKLKLGRAREAIEDLDLGLKVLPRDREAYLWRGEAKRVLGDYAGALVDLNEAPLEGYGSSRWFWHDANRGLVYAKLGDARAMRADFEAIPRPVVRYVMRRLGLRERRRTADADIPRILTAALRLSKGYRRPEFHGQAAWMGAAGRNPRDWT